MNVMQERLPLSDAEIDSDLLRFVTHTPRWFWYVAGFLGLFVLAAGVCVLLIILEGLQLAGYNNNVYWAFFITNFVFWIEISHAGVLISALLRLTNAEWRRPITRCAESLAIFALMTAGLFPIIHTGRLWRTLYWILPYDYSRNVWPAIRSPLIWDPSAIVTYLVGTTLFVSVGLIPDVANLRDHSTGLRHTIYRVLAMGFHGTARQWRLQHQASQLLSALILPVFVSVTSIVAWDFAMATVPGWHTTIYAPYFVIGAVYSGVAAVITTMALLRKGLRLQAYITPQHFEILGRMQIAVLLTYLFFAITDFIFGFYSHDPVEQALWQLRLLTPPTSFIFYLHLLLAIIIPFPVLYFRRLRSNPRVMLILAIATNVGMYLEHYLDVVTPLAYKQPFTFMWVSTYTPHVVEYVITLGSVALVALGVLVFAKVFPIVPIHSVKEGQHLRHYVRVGRALVPAVMREE